nr:hypothetical protein [Micromonospora sp. DSM 115978]
MAYQRTNPKTGLLDQINGPHHRAAVNIFAFIVVAHWAEHIVQAVQIWGLGWTRPQSRGVLGMPFPWLVEQEWLHYGYALIMLVGFWALRKGFVGQSRSWWMLAFWIQVWHHFEHLILLLQWHTGLYLAGKAAPTSIIQLIVPRVELHLFYNAVVTLPMLVAMYYHLRPNRVDAAAMTCSCHARPVGAAA